MRPNATADVLSALASGTSNMSANVAVNAYYNEGRNEFAANFYILPILTSLLTPALAEANANISAQFVAANVGNQTALSNFVGAISAPGTPAVVAATYHNLRPFTAPVVSALTEVGMILIVIFSFILVCLVFPWSSTSIPLTVAFIDHGKQCTTSHRGATLDAAVVCRTSCVRTSDCTHTTLALFRCHFFAVPSSIQRKVYGGTGLLPLLDPLLHAHVRLRPRH